MWRTKMISSKGGSKGGRSCQNLGEITIIAVGPKRIDDGDIDTEAAKGIAKECQRRAEREVLIGA